jgi:non-specific serine/threonine protein kinase
MSQQRSRGILLTDEGLERLEAALNDRWNALPDREKHARYRTTTLTNEVREALLGCSRGTVRRILQRQPADRSTIVKAFESVGCAWQEAYCRLPSGEEKAPRPRRAGDAEEPDGGGLPALPAHSVARGKEVDALVRRLDTTRLVTLTGVGGVGKTWLAKAVAHAVRHQYRRHVCWVELDALNAAEQVTPKVAAALGVQKPPDGDLLTALCVHLHARRLLLVLDNCEHLLPACAHLARRLLETCPFLRLLATSRQALGVPDEETEAPVLPLSAPPQGVPVTAESALTYHAVQLFALRAAAASPDFKITDANAPQVARLCRHLDGLPLAIELVAANLRGRTFERMARDLDAYFALPADTGAARPARHQTLMAALDWSYERLPKAERLLFCRLAAFRGGWAEEAAIAIGAGEGIEPWEVAALLSRLVAQSLAVFALGSDGEGRYRLLESVREYARTRLEKAHEAEAVYARHGDYYAQQAEEAEPLLTGEEAARGLGWFEREQANLEAALGWCQQANAIERGLRLAVSLSCYWLMCGYLGRGRTALAGLLAGAEAMAPSPELAKAQNAAALLAWRQGLAGEARALFQQSERTFRQVGDRASAAKLLGNLGEVAAGQGDFKTARRFLHRAHAALRKTGDRFRLAGVCGSLGAVAFYQGEVEAARGYFLEGLALGEELKDAHLISKFCVALGGAELLASHYEEARRCFARALPIQKRLRDRQGCQQSLHNLGIIARMQDDLAAAHRRYLESLRLARMLDDKRSLLQSLEELAALATAQGEGERAARLFGAADRLREETQLPRPPTEREEYDQCRLCLCGALGAAGFDAAWNEGKALPLKQAVAFALG